MSVQPIDFSKTGLIVDTSPINVTSAMNSSQHDFSDRDHRYIRFQHLEDSARVIVKDHEGIIRDVSLKEAKENFYVLQVGGMVPKNSPVIDVPMLFDKVPETAYASVNQELKHMSLISLDSSDNHDPRQFAALKFALAMHAKQEAHETKVMSEPDYAKKIHAATDARLAAKKDVETALNTLIGNDQLRDKKPIAVVKVPESALAMDGSGQALSSSQGQLNASETASVGAVAGLVSPEVLRMHGLPEDFLTSDSDFYMLVLMALKTEKSRKSALALKGLQDNTSLLKAMNNTLSSISAAINKPEKSEVPNHYFEYQNKWYLSGEGKASDTKLPSGETSNKLKDIPVKTLEEMQRYFTNETTVFQNTQQLLLSSVQDQMGKEQTFASLMSDLCKLYQQMRDTPVSKMA